MEMEKLSVSVHWLPALVVILLMTASDDGVAAVCTQATIGGGCPNVHECVEVCRPCYRGVGRVYVFCQPAGGGILVDQCVCEFLKGAPCNPPAPPRCPAKWPPAAAVHEAFNATAGKIIFINQTHAVITD